MLRGQGANVDVGHDLGTSSMNNDNQRSSSPILKRVNSVGRISQSRKNNFVKRLNFSLLSSKLLGIRPSKTNSTLEVHNKDPYRGSRSLDMTLLAQKPYMSSPVLALPNYSNSMRNSFDEGAAGSASSSSYEGNDDVRSAVGAITAHAREEPTSSIKVVKTANNKESKDTTDTSDKSPMHSSTPTRPAIPRLTTLPPLAPLSPLPAAFVMSPSKRPGDDVQERARLSPSVVVRAPPFPILSLPPVSPIAGPSSATSPSPPATFGPSARGRSFTLDFSPSSPSFATMPPQRRPRARLNTMPMLPREGQDVHPDGDEESDQEVEAYLDEDEDDGEETEMDDGRLGARTPDSEEDEDDDHHAVEQTPKGKGKEASGRRPFATPRMPSIGSLISTIPTPGLPRTNSLGLSSFLTAAGVGKGSSNAGPGMAGSSAGQSTSGLNVNSSNGRGLGSGLPPTSASVHIPVSSRTATANSSSLASSSSEGVSFAAVTQQRSGGDEDETPNYNNGQGRQWLPTSFASKTPRPTLSVRESTTSPSGSTSASAQKRDYFSLGIPSSNTSSSSSTGSSSNSSTSPSSGWRTSETSEEEWEPLTPTVQDYSQSHTDTQAQKFSLISSQAVPSAHPPVAGAQKANNASANSKKSGGNVIEKKIVQQQQLYIRDPLLTPRPGLYHQASKSMVDLLSMKSPRLDGEDEQSVVKPMDSLYRNSRGTGVGGKGERTGVGKEGIVGADAGAGTLTHANSDGKAGVAVPPSNTSLQFDAAPARVRDGSSTLMFANSPESQQDISLRPGTSSGVLSGPGVGAAPSPTTGSPQPDANAFASDNKMSARGSTLRRRRSMPTFTASGPPPPYPSFLLPENNNNGHRHGIYPNGFAPAPREEEGCEALPPYTNDIKLMAIMPRKMEFGAPGIPAKDRKWRRVQVVLEGTVLKVYECPSKVSGVNPISGWWEKKVGVGDIALANGGTTTQNGVVVIGARRERRPMKWEEELRAEEERRGSVETASSAASTVESDAQTSNAEDSDARPDPHPIKKKHHLASAFLHPHFSRSRQNLHPSANPQERVLGHSRARSVSPAPSQTHSRENSMPRSSLQVNRSGAFEDDTRRASSMDLPAGSSSRSVSRMSETTTPSASASSVSVNSNPSSSHSHSSSLSHHFRSHHHHRNRDPAPNTTTSSSTSPTDSLGSGKEVWTEPNRKDLIREYSMQNAESGLASDYFKRKNVLRVRMQGEQFLLQAADVPGVIEWIEGLQAAANIALDLDDRPMPKGPIFPRRRRRRRAVVVQPAGGEDTAVPTNIPNPNP